MKFQEKELEDYLEQNPSAPFSIGKYDDPNLTYTVYGRQVSCKMGRIDLIIGAYSTIYIVELKARRATFEDVGQVTRYALAAMKYTWPRFPKIITAIDHTDYANASMRVADSIAVDPLLIAPSFTKRVNDAIHCIQVTRTDDGTFSFARMDSEPHAGGNAKDSRLESIMDLFGRTYAFATALHGAGWEIGQMRKAKQ